MENSKSQAVVKALNREALKKVNRVASVAVVLVVGLTVLVVAVYAYSLWRAFHLFGLSWQMFGLTSLVVSVIFAYLLGVLIGRSVLSKSSRRPVLPVSSL